MTESSTVQATVAVSGPGETPASSSPASPMTRKTIDASPRGPNQPMKRTVDRWSRRPSNVTATGTIRKTVKLRAAYAIAAGSHSVVRTLPARVSPNAAQTPIASSDPCVSVNSIAPVSP